MPVADGSIVPVYASIKVTILLSAASLSLLLFLFRVFEYCGFLYLCTRLHGELAQLARAPALQAGGHRFDSDILHKRGQL